jgi:hypothetical protein
VPQAAQQRSIPFNQVWKQLAGVRARFIDGAEIAIQKNAAVFVALENAAFLFCFLDIVAQKDGALDTQEASQAVGVALRDRCGSDAAAIGASGAIDLFFNILGDGFKTALDEVVAFEPGAKTFIFFALLFAETFDLDKIGKHCFQYRNKSFRAEFVFRAAARR